jgi:phosphatidylglycerol:prolipoprotein diacylglycerol transferase
MEPLIPYFEVVKIPITGDFAIHGFGILVALGFVIGSKIAMDKAARDGLDPEVINRLVGWLVAGVFIGGHWGHLLMYYPEQIAEDPLNLIRFWQGLSSFGGFIGCAVLGIWFFRRENRKIRAQNQARHAAGEPLMPRLDVWGYADACLYGFTLGWASGRTGCFVAHDHPGTVTNFALGVKGMMNPNSFDAVEKLAWMKAQAAQFPELASMTVSQRIPEEIWQQVAYHDLGLYEVIWSLCMFGIFWVLDKKPRKPGFFVGLTFIAYGPVRLLMDVFRHPTTDTRYLGLTPAQYLSVALVAVGAWMIWSNRNERTIAERNQPRPAPAAAPSSEGAAD